MGSGSGSHPRMRAMSRQTPAGMSSMKNVAAAACEMAVMMRMPDRSRSRSAPPRVARAPNAMSRSAMARPAASSPGSTPAAGRGSPMCRDDAPYLIVVRLSHAAGVRAVRYRRASIPRRPAYGQVNFQRLRFRCSLSCLVSVLSPVSFPAKASTIVQMRHVMRMSVVPGSIAIRFAALLFDVFRA